ncbi:MAG: hypothetical protein HUJ68_01300 [Clostridia bacterium]|nr:hypothetical protein [Clostridia bacterium]
MKKLIISIVFMLFACFTAFAEVICTPTEQRFGIYTVFQVQCSSVKEYEEYYERYLNSDMHKIINTYDSDLTIEVVYLDCVGVDC